METIAKGTITNSPTMANRTKAIVAFSFLSVVWGSTWAVAKAGVLEMPVLTLSYLRNGIAGIILVGYFLVKGYPFPKGKSLYRHLLLSIFLFVFNTGLSIWSLRFIPAHTAAIIGCTSPLMIYILQALLYGKGINAVFIIGCIISFFGVVLLVYDGATIQQAGYLSGVALSFLAVIAWCFGFVLMEGKKDSMDLYYSFGWQLLFSSAILYLVATFTGNTVSLTGISTKGWMAIGYLSVFGSVMAFVCLAFIIKHLPPGIASLYVFINPVVAVVISVLMLYEELTYAVVIGALLALLGVWLSISRRKNNSSFQKHSANQSFADKY